MDILQPDMECHHMLAVHQQVHHQVYIQEYQEIPEVQLLQTQVELVHHIRAITLGTDPPQPRPIITITRDIMLRDHRIIHPHQVTIKAQDTKLNSRIE